MKKKLNYDYCQAAPVLEWMSQKWALVVMLRIEEYEKESIRFSELFRTIPQVSEKVLASTLDYLLTSSLRHPKILIKEFSYFLMPCHQHGLRINLLV